MSLTYLNVLGKKMGDVGRNAGGKPILCIDGDGRMLYITHGNEGRAGMRNMREVHCCQRTLKKLGKESGLPLGETKALV